MEFGLKRAYERQADAITTAHHAEASAAAAAAAPSRLRVSRFVDGPPGPGRLIAHCSLSSPIDDNNLGGGGGLGESARLRGCSVGGRRRNAMNSRTRRVVNSTSY